MVFAPQFKGSYEEPLKRVMCSGTVKSPGPRQGMPCGRVAALGFEVCIFHGAHLPGVQEEARNMVLAARVELMSQATDAAQVIFDLAQNASSEAVRLKAAESLLDRVGVRGGTELSIQAEVTVSRATDILNERLNKLAKGAERRSDQEATAALAITEAPEGLHADSVSEEVGDVVEGEIVEMDEPRGPGPSFPPGYLGRLSRHRTVTERVEVPGTGASVAASEIALPDPGSAHPQPPASS